MKTDINGYEKEYQIWSNGKVWSYKTHKFLKPSIDTKGYLKVTLSSNGFLKGFFVHKLVAEHFIRNPNNYKEINHKDENKENNDMSNLEWCSHSYNINYGNRNKIVSIKQKAKDTGKKIAKLDYLTGEILEIYASSREAAQKNNLSQGNISSVCLGRRQTCGGYGWKYI